MMFSVIKLEEMDTNLVLKPRMSFLISLAVFFLFLAAWILATKAEWIGGDWRSQLKGYGSLAGVAGYWLFAFSLFLSSRWPRLENWFGGLDRIYHLHHQFGMWGFVLILIHPLLIGAMWLPQMIGRFLWFTFPVHGRLTVNLGAISFWLMIIAIGVTLVKIFPYDKWKITHKFMSLVFLLASYHVLFAEHKISPSFFTNSLMYIPFFLGLYGIFYNQIYNAYLKQKPVFKVVRTNFFK